MPKMIGKDLECGMVLTNNVSVVPGYVRITYAQAAKLTVGDRAKSLDTTDKGGRRSLAKRWYRWFGVRESVLRLGTASAIRRAGGAR